MCYSAQIRIAHPTKLKSGYCLYVNRRPKFDLPKNAKNFWTLNVTFNPKSPSARSEDQRLSRHRLSAGPKFNPGVTTLQSDCRISLSRSAGVRRGRVLEYSGGTCPLRQLLETASHFPVSAGNRLPRFGLGSCDRRHKSSSSRKGRPTTAGTPNRCPWPNRMEDRTGLCLLSEALCCLGRALMNAQIKIRIDRFAWLRWCDFRW